MLKRLNKDPHKKGIATPTFVTCSPLQRHIKDGGQSKCCEIGISRNKAKRVLKKYPKLLKEYFGENIL